MSALAKGPRLRRLRKSCLNLTGSNQPIKYAPRSQATLVRNRIGSPVRAQKRDLGFESAIELSEGLRRLIDWRRAHIAEVETRRSKLAV